MKIWKLIRGGQVWQILTTPDDQTLPQPYVQFTPEEAAAWIAANPEPEPTVNTPQEVGGGQITAAMIELDYAATPEALDALIVGIIEAAVPAGKDRQKAIALWRRAGTFKRDHPMIEAVRQVMGKSHAEIDQLFQLADTL